jgi:hypothetical protein
MGASLAATGADVFLLIIATKPCERADALYARKPQVRITAI